MTEMAALCRDHRPKHAVMADDSAAEALREMLADLPEVEVSAGSEVLDKLVAAPEIDTVVAGIVGFVKGLRSRHSVRRAPERQFCWLIKEALVSAGGFSWQRFGSGGATLLPVDSEHNAMHQCLPIHPSGRPDMGHVEKIVLTASVDPSGGGHGTRFETSRPRRLVPTPIGPWARKSRSILRRLLIKVSNWRKRVGYLTARPMKSRSWFIRRASSTR